MATLGKYEQDGMTVIGQICVAVLGRWSDVFFISLVERCDFSVGCAGALVFRFVVQQRNLKVTFASRFLQQSKIVVRVGIAIPVPVHNESGYSHVPSLFDLLSQDGWVLARVANVDVIVITEPRHIDSQKFRRHARRLRVLLQRVMSARSRAPGGQHK